MKLLFTSLVLLIIGITRCWSYANFRDRIPNGHKVSSPCNSSLIWNGVGHMVTGGGGTRNPFGKAFAAAEFKWTESLCKADSDEDGQTNGQELGDPDCVWKTGQTPARITGITHPGICEPVESIECRVKNEYEFCPKPFSCPELNKAGVVSKNATIQKSAVPAKETTYICQMVELDVTGKQMHLIGSKPVIDNENVLHHMILYGCPKETTFKADPFECLMSVGGCNDMIALWGVGVSGECMNKEAGIMLDGTGGKKVYAVLQLHWNNPQRISTYKDGSGFELFMTPNLRPNNAGIAIYGQRKLQIPPNQISILRQQTCPKGCSQKFLPGTRKLMTGIIHMHNYGNKGRVMLMRNGKLIKDLVPMHTYDYNVPVINTFETPVDYLPGDEIITQCYFNTQKTKDYVYYGESTQDEMCFSFFHYYPFNITTSEFQLGNCVGIGDLNTCMMRDASLVGTYNIKGCYVGELYGDAMLNRNANISEICSKAVGEFCDPKCKAMLPSFYTKEACFDPKRARPEVNYLLSTSAFIGSTKRLQYLNFLKLLDKCETELAMETATTTTTTTKMPSTSVTTQSQTGGLSSEHIFIITIVAISVGSLTIIVIMFILAMKLKGMICAGKGSDYAM